MNEVQAIKDRRHIESIKQALHGRDLLLFTVGINVGLRISDLLALKVRDLRGQDAVKIREGKTGKVRLFALNNAVKLAVESLLADCDDEDYVFKSRKGVNKPISNVQVHRLLNSAIKRAGLSNQYRYFGAHSLRKTFGYFAYNSGADITLLMRIFNHSAPSVTLRYIGVEQDDIDNVYHAINL